MIEGDNTCPGKLRLDAKERGKGSVLAWRGEAKAFQKCNMPDRNRCGNVEVNKCTSNERDKNLVANKVRHLESVMRSARGGSLTRREEVMR